MTKNTAGQSIGAQMIDATNGAAFAGVVTVYITIDAGTQALGSVGSGVCVSEGHGYFSYQPSQAETNGDLIAFTFVGSGAIPATIQVQTLTAAVAAALSGGSDPGGTTFLRLYGVELDRELAANSTSPLFTVARRKLAVNWAQLEFVKQTECLKRNTTIPLVTETPEYDIEATVSDFALIAKAGPSIRITSTNGSVRYIQGDDFQETSVERLNHERPGWRGESAGTPDSYYLDPDGGAINFGLVPAPSITAGDTWVLMLPYVIVPNNMVDDADEPFTVGANSIRSLRMYHRGLVHGAAYDLEKYRKDDARSAKQYQLFKLEIEMYKAGHKPKMGQHIRMATNYRRLPTSRRMDPRT